MRAAAALFVVVAALPALPLHAERRSGDTVHVGRDEVIVENLTVVGGTVSIHGTVQGDLVVAGGNVVVDGIVQGDVLAAGGQVLLGGQVRGDVRAVGGQLELRAPVEGDVALAGGEVTVGGTVGRDAAIAGGRLVVTGPVSRDLLLAGGEVSIDSAVGASVRVQGGRVVIGPQARVAGDVVATTAEPVVVAEGAVLTGGLRQERIEGTGPAARVVTWVQAVVGFFLLGLLWTWLFRGFAGRANATLRAKPWPSLGVGALVFFGTPLVLALTLALGVVVGGWWIALLGAAVYAAVLLLAVPLFALAAGSALLPGGRLSPRRTWLVLLGAVTVLLLLFQIPVLGGLLAFATLLFGSGAIALSLPRTLRRTRTPDRSTRAREDVDAADAPVPAPS